RLVVEPEPRIDEPETVQGRGEIGPQSERLRQVRDGLLEVPGTGGEIAEMEERIRIAAVRGDRLLVELLGLGVLPLRLGEASQPVERRGEVFLDPEGAGILRLCVLLITQPQIAVPERDVRLKVVRLEVQRGLERLDRILVAARGLEREAQVVV